ncbi:ABC transporter permease subunit [Beduinella massiliensis]|uniref:ABC transporter permease subunit n=1 Tax=Beduinella massiliensis TaxID=1852363 RepID=UPI000C8375ED
MKKRISTFDVSVYILLALFSLLCLIPLLNTVAVSFSDKTSAAAGHVYFWPVNFTLAAYKEMLNDRQFFVSFGVSVVRVLIGISLHLTFSVPMAYALSRQKAVFRAHDIYMWLLVFTMLFNGGMVATYIWIKTLGLLDTIWALTLPWAVQAYNIIVLMNYMKGLPHEIEEAALIDGSNPFNTLMRIIIPLSTPSIATISLLCIVGHWNDYFSGRIYINTSSKLPLQTYIYALSAEMNTAALVGLSPEAIEAKMRISSLTFNCAKVVVATIPVLILYPWLQKYFVKGLVMGAVKG